LSAKPDLNYAIITVSRLASLTRHLHRRQQHRSTVLTPWRGDNRAAIHTVPRFCARAGSFWYSSRRSGQHDKASRQLWLPRKGNSFI